MIHCLLTILMRKPESWRKKLIVFIAAADLGAIGAGLSAHFGLVPHWLSRISMYLAGDLPTSFEVWIVYLVIILAFIVGCLLVAAPCFTPALYGFLPEVGHHSRGHHGFRHLLAFAIGVFVEAILLGAFLGAIGRIIFTQTFLFTESAGKTPLAIFGFWSILMIYLALSEFGFLKPIDWLSPIYRLANRLTARSHGTLQSFLSGLVNGGALGVGCPAPIYFAIFITVAIMGNVTFGVLAFLAFAVGRLTPIFYLILRQLRHRDATHIIKWISEASPKSQSINAAVLILLGSYFFIFWWIYASLSAFLY